MSKVSKTATEWLGELNILEKKIEKLESKITESPLALVCTKQDSALYKSDITKKREELKSNLDALKALTANKKKIREALLSYNATSFITIGEETYSIAIALEMLKQYKGYSNYSNILDHFKRSLDNVNRSKNKLLKEKEAKESELVAETSKKANSSMAKDFEAIKTRLEDYNPEVHEFVDIEGYIHEEEEKESTFMNLINTQLNLANAKNIIDIEL